MAMIKDMMVGTAITAVNVLLMWQFGYLSPKTPKAVALATASEDCLGAFEQSWPPPPFECPFGLPNPQCLWEAQIAYEQYMQMAAFTKCEAIKAATQQLEDDLHNCEMNFILCILNAPSNAPAINCIHQSNQCEAKARAKCSTALAAASTQFYEDMNYATEQFYTSALECCPQ